MDKIYIVETASFYADKGTWDTNTSTNYFRSKARAAAFCEKWMANYVRDYANGYVSNRGASGMFPNNQTKAYNYD